MARMYTRAGYDDQGLVLSDIDDIPMWSKKTLTAVKPQNFFDVGGGPNESTSLLTPNMIDQTKDFDVKRIEINFMRTSKAPLDAAALVLIALAVSDYFVQFFTNETKRSWNAPVHAIIRAPMQVAAAGAMAYNPAWIQNGGANINMPDGQGLIVKGGTGFQVLLNSSVAASDLSGLDMSVVLWGRRYALVVAKSVG